MRCPKNMHTSTAELSKDRLKKIKLSVSSMYIRTRRKKRTTTKTHLSKSISIDAISLYKKYTVP